MFSLEMERAELDARLISMAGKVDYKLLEARRLGDAEWVGISRAIARVADLPLYVDDHVPTGIPEVRSRVRTLARQGRLGLVVVDYLQLLQCRAPGKRQRQEIVGEFARELKLLAREFHVPVLVLSQLNRGAEQRADRKPSMTDLRESGDIENNADVVALLHRDDDGDRPAEISLIMPKNRQGPRGGCLLRFQGHYCRIEGSAHGWAEQEADAQTPGYQEAS